MKRNKKLCPTHMFHYSGNNCPFCEQERISHMCKKFNKPKIIKPKPVYKEEITVDDIEKLKAKFNNK